MDGCTVARAVVIDQKSSVALMSVTHQSHIEPQPERLQISKHDFDQIGGDILGK